MRDLEKERADGSAGSDVCLKLMQGGERRDGGDPGTEKLVLLGGSGAAGVDRWGGCQALAQGPGGVVK